MLDDEHGQRRYDREARTPAALGSARAIDVQPAAFPQTPAPNLTPGGPQAARATVGAIGGRGNADEMHRATACVEPAPQSVAAGAAGAGRVSALAALAALGSIGSEGSTGQSDGASTDVPEDIR